jgi:enoyl-CoA hydratase/carnithine racemase
MSELAAPADELLVEEADGVLTLTFNRPAVHNAVNSRVYIRLREALDRAASDPGRLEDLPKPLVVAVNGVAVGVGVTLLGHADIVLAGQSARFRMPFASLGLSPEAGASYTMPARMGVQNAAHALFTGDWISAEAAAASGLVRTLVADDVLRAEASALCARIAAMPVASLVATKQALLANRLDAARASREREEAVFRRLQEGPDHAEALAAFAERRKPVFRRP